MIKLEMTGKQEIILAVIIIAATLVLLLLHLGVGRAPAEHAAEPVSIFTEVTEIVEQQARTDEWMLSQLGGGIHDFNNPLVVVDPYGMSPLTALALFITDEPTSVTVQVAGKTDDVSVGYTFSDYRTNHIIPVFGLYPDMYNLIELTATTQDGFTESKILMIRTGALPEAWPDSIISAGLERERLDIYEATLDIYEASEVYDMQDMADNEFYFTHIIKSAFDQNGDCRWFYSDIGLSQPSWYTYHGNMIIIVGTLIAGDALTIEVNKLGRIVSIEDADLRDVTGYDASRVERRALYTYIAYDLGLGTPVHISVG